MKGSYKLSQFENPQNVNMQLTNTNIIANVY